MRHRTLSAFAIAFGLATGSKARAQTDSPGNRDARLTSCDAAIKAVADGHPAHRETAALSYLQLCRRDGARQMASALSGTRSEADTSALIAFYYTANPWRDADVLNAAIQLVVDSAATTPARGFGILYLMHLIRPGFSYLYSEVIRGSADFTVRPSSPDHEAIEGLPCRIRGFSTGGPAIVGTPLPSDFVSRIHGVLAQIADDSAVPQALRNAAQCGRHLE